MGEHVRSSGATLFWAVVAFSLQIGLVAMCPACDKSAGACPSMSGGSTGPCDCTYNAGIYTCYADPSTGAGRYIRPACPADASPPQACGYTKGECMSCSDGVSTFCSCTDAAVYGPDGGPVGASGNHWTCSGLGSPTCSGP